MAFTARLAALKGALTTPGRKGEALDKALVVLLVLAVLASDDATLSQSALDSLLMGLAGILATFTGGNAAEHWTTGRKPPPGAQDGQP